MTELLKAVTSWPSLVLVLIVFGLAPGFCLRLIVLAYPRDDPRRAELIAELYAVSRIQRPLWVAEQLEVALSEGLKHRVLVAIHRITGRPRTRARTGKRGVSDVTREAVLLLTLFLINCFVYSAWVELITEAGTRPWLLVVWLYGLLGLVPLAWRDDAPVAVFATQWVLAVAAWPVMDHYIPVVGLTVALYWVSAHRGRRVALLALLASCVSLGIDLAAELRLPHGGHDLYQAFVTQGVLLVAVVGGAWALGRWTRPTCCVSRDLEHYSSGISPRSSGRRRENNQRMISYRLLSGDRDRFRAAEAARIANTNFTQVIQSLAPRFRLVFLSRPTRGVLSACY